MDKRYQVFVSSTYEDLREERQEVMQALLELDCIPAGMELFPAANDDQWTLIKKVIDDCDYYIVVIGGRYGSVGPSGISYTQMEYEYAIEQNKPVIGFLHKDPSSIPAKRTEKSEKNQKLLEAFRELAQQKMCKFWTNPADLGSAVSRSLIKLIKSSPAVGWVKADLLPTKDTTEEMLRLRQKVEELQNQIAEKDTGVFENLQELSQGDDKVHLNLSFGLNKEGSKYRYRPDYYLTKTISTTWNKVFSVISPLLIDEASGLVIKKRNYHFIEFSY